MFKKSANLIAAIVWNGGECNGYAQHSYRTAFILQGDAPLEDSINTNAQWKAFRNESYAPVIFKRNDQRLFWQYYVAGALDRADAAQHPWNWEKKNFNDSGWLASKELDNGYPAGTENRTQLKNGQQTTLHLQYNSAKNTTCF